MNSNEFNGKWTLVKDSLPPAKGDYIVSCIQKRWDGTIWRKWVTIVYFRGKTTWATLNDEIYAWMSLPEAAEVIEND